MRIILPLATLVSALALLACAEKSSLPRAVPSQTAPVATATRMPTARAAGAQPLVPTESVPVAGVTFVPILRLHATRCGDAVTPNGSPATACSGVAENVSGRALTNIYLRLTVDQGGSERFLINELSVSDSVEFHLLTAGRQSPKIGYRITAETQDGQRRIIIID